MNIKNRFEEMEKYIQLASKLKMLHYILISPEQIYFDIRAWLKCRWGCEFNMTTIAKCSDKGTTFRERVEMVKSYHRILLVHSNDAFALSKVVLKIERESFLDGYYFAFAIRTCCLCNPCHLMNNEACPTPEKIRPCDSLFGIDMYKTTRKLGLPCEVLKNKDDVQNRYGLVLID